MERFTIERIVGDIALENLLLVTVSSMSEILVVAVIFFICKHNVDDVIDITFIPNFVEFFINSSAEQSLLQQLSDVRVA